MREPSASTARLPASYADASVRCVLPFCPVRSAFGLAFDVPGLDAPVRLALSVAQQQLLRDMLGTYSSELACQPAEEGAHA